MTVPIFSMTFSGSGFVLVDVASNGCCGWNVKSFFGNCEKTLLNVGGDGWLNVGGGGGGDRLKLFNVGGGGGGCGGGIKLLNVGGGDGGDEELLLFLLLKKISPLKASSLFCMSLVSPSFGAFLSRSLAISFLPISSYLSKEPTTGFCASNIQMPWKTSSKGFCLRKIFFHIESSLCLKLALLLLSLVT